MLIAVKPYVNEESIPSKVFFNHIFSLKEYISTKSNLQSFVKSNFFKKLSINNPSFDIQECQKYIWNSWSTEYAFHMSLVGNDFKGFAFQWQFPQAYYSIYMNLISFHYTQGYSIDQHSKSLNIFSDHVNKGHYPKEISFLVSGEKDNFIYSGFEEMDRYPEKFNALVKPRTNLDYEEQIACFLKSTRNDIAAKKKDVIVNSKPNKKNIFYQTQKGDMRQTFSKKHWAQLYKSISFTSILHFIYKLRIKANYDDINSFIKADIDFDEFHSNLGFIINYLNQIHELLIVKVVGIVEYEKFLFSFDNHIVEELATKRFKKIEELI